MFVETTAGASERSEGGLEFGVLGPVQVLADGRQITLGRPAMRGLLAMLVLEANQIVPIDRIVDGLWEDDPPATARTIVHGYVSRLRRLLEQVDPSGSARILTRPPGYLLSVEPERLDVNRAMRLVSAARGKQPAVRAGLLREALGLWRGPVLADVPGRPVTADLDELRLAALEERIEAELELGRHLELVGELRQLVTEHPFRERLVAQIMRALYRSGRRADALAAYQQFHRRVVGELGLDPGPDLRALHEQVLRDDPALRVDSAARTVPPRVGVIVPAQLPPAATGFTGRDDELAWLDELGAQHRPGAAAVGVLTGAPGVGKSALAITWGHRRAERFPDGQLFGSMRGFDPRHDPVDPADVLTKFLVALGVPADGVPSDVDDRAAMYRSLLARRRVFVVLDDVRDSEQVRPLLPAGSGSVVLVTSRRRLDGLAVSSGARLLGLDTLTEDAAVALLHDAIGAPPSAFEPADARKLAELCGYLPLALRIAAARLAASPQWTLGGLVDALSDERNRLRWLDIEEADASVSCALDVSYRNLPSRLREAFRLIGAVQLPSVGPHTVAALCGVDPEIARGWLEELAQAHLLTRPRPGRFAMHDLVRLYTRELAEAELDESTRRLALLRLLDYHLVACDHGRRLLQPPRDELDFAARDGGATALPALDTPARALEWFELEWQSQVALAHAAAQAGEHRHVWQLVRLLHSYCYQRATADAWFPLVRFGLASARLAGDRLGELLMLNTLCGAHQRFGRMAETLADAEAALEIATELGEARYLGLALEQLGGVLFELGRKDNALARYREALSLARDRGEKAAQARSLNNIAQVERGLGRRETAAAHQFEAMELNLAAGDRHNHVIAVCNLAELYAELGRHADAEELARRGAALAEAEGMTSQEGFARQILGQVLAELGKTGAAIVELEESLRLYQQVNSPRVSQIRVHLAALASDV
ncbi:tetratricopeptide repeat protein [Solihabitans fulvus]|uniref:Tetratricopeptide repeat protein n=1 Tax=Solihabitans fulvus TaxID=1892852 RepID=A0A5B2XF30_9PSEU|nr:BTAD domain-containing putative transcriptional regulator [Solihabitans fulvus]KAA2262377.1 tetratricopeptide repeat protein [Solihabitans fulvus]